MRPQPLSCGNCKAIIRFVNAMQPSMRPQPLSCGNTRTNASLSMPKSFNEAATSQLRKPGDKTLADQTEQWLQ